MSVDQQQNREETRYIWFLVKNLDLDSNLYNMKKQVKYYETDPNPNRPYS
jgi:hypothetical protein